MLNKQKRPTKRSWMTHEIHQLMEKRRAPKGINNDQYRMTQQEENMEIWSRKRIILY